MILQTLSWSPSPERIHDIRDMGRKVSFHSGAIHAIITGNLEACLNKLRFHVAWTNYCLQIIGVKGSTIDASCQSIDSTTNVFCHWAGLNHERATL